MAIGGNSILCNPSFTSSLPFTSPPVHIISLSSTRIPHYHHRRRHLGISFGSKPPPSLLLQRRSRCFRCSRRKAGRLAVFCGGATVIDQSRFKEEVLDSDKPVLVDFVADWCGPCRLIAPVVDWVSQEYEDQLKVVKIDHDANPQLIEKYKVQGLPTLIIFKDGEEVPESRREGAITKVKLKEFLDSFLEKIAVS